MSARLNLIGLYQDGDLAVLRLDTDKGTLREAMVSERQMLQIMEVAATILGRLAYKREKAAKAAAPPKAQEST